MTGQPGPGHGRKLGHRGVDASGETTYKKVPPLPLAGWDGVKRGLPVVLRARLLPLHTQGPLKLGCVPWPCSWPRPLL